MNGRNNVEYSRVRATAKSLGAMASNSHCFTDKAVLLTGEPEILASDNGRRCFLYSFRLLLRMVRNLTVQLPGAGPLADEVLREADRLSYDVRPTIQVGGLGRLEGFDAVLAVGITGGTDLPWTVVNSNGWLARVSSGGASIASECSQANPIGALAAASLGVAEVFKRLIHLRPERGELSQGSSFSFYTYSESASAGPELPVTIPLDLVAFGAGAIGNGIVQLLCDLPVAGRAVFVDRQVFEVENWGTCCLIGPREFAKAKAEWAATVLNPKLATAWLHGTVEEYMQKCGKEFPFPRLILNGLDNISARRAVQGLWPDLIIDGAIGPTVCEVTLHPWEGDCSCLRCDFEEPPEEALAVQARSTGLRLGRLANPLSVVDETDVEAAPEELKGWLRLREGKQVCSVVSEAVLAGLSAEAQKEGFEPSAPFVACLSACMMVTEMVRFSLGWASPLHTGFQFDSLVGPQNGMLKIHSRKRDCECYTRRRNIEKVRAARRNG